MRYKYEGSKHHRIIPVIDSAVRTALVLEEYVAYRAEEEDAHDIAYAVCKGYEDKHTRIDDIGKIEDAEYEVKGYPTHCKDEGSLPGGESRLAFRGGDKVALKLLLTSDGLKLGGEDTEYHSGHKE